MPDVPDKQVKRLRALIEEAETSLAAAKELLISLVGDDEKAVVFVLEGQTIFNAADEMPQMQLSRGSVAGQQTFLLAHQLVYKPGVRARQLCERRVGA